MFELIRQIFRRGQRDPIIPPMGNGQSLHSYPEPMPHFRFGVASLVGTRSDRKILISIAYPEIDVSPYSKLTTINDPYEVQVPEFDGDRIVGVTPETKTRQCEIAVQENEEAVGANTPLLFHCYSIGVPYTRYDDHGHLKNEYRVEIRRRMAVANEIPVGFSPAIVNTKYELDQLESYSPMGKRLTTKQLSKKLKTETPVLLVNDPQFVTAYFSTLIRSCCVIIVENGNGIAAE